MSARPLRVGFLGAGWVAQLATAPAAHAADGVVLQAVAARDARRAFGLEPAGRVHADYADLLADDDVDAVYVNLSNEAHLPWTLAALRAGKHVLCEKPLALDAGQVAELVGTAAVADRVLVEALWYRWHPRTRRLAELAATGALGPVVAVEASFTFDGLGTMRAAGNYRLDGARGGGALLDVGAYTLSAAHLLAGDLDVVSAVVRPDAGGVDAGFEARLAGSRGAASVAGGFDGEPAQVLRVTGGDAVAEATTGEAFTAWKEPSALRIATPDGQVREEAFPPVDAYALMFEAFAARCRGEDAFVVDLAHSAQVAVTSDAVRAAWHPAP